MYYGHLSSLSMFKAVWYMVKDSELRGNCSPTHVLLSPSFSCWSTSMGNKPYHFMYIFIWRVVWGKSPPHNNFLLIWILIIFRWCVLYKNVPYSNLGNRPLLFRFYTEWLLMIDRFWLWSEFGFFTSNHHRTLWSVKTIYLSVEPFNLNNNNIYTYQFICQIPSPRK